MDFMRKRYFLNGTACLAFAFMMLSCEPVQGEFSYNAPIALSDPYILEHDGVYYAYGAGDPDGIAVYRSTDLDLWVKESTLALHKDNSYGEDGFSSPCVIYSPIDDKYFMYYTAAERICTATSASPLGPFVQSVQKPMLDSPAYDPSVFRDADGTLYLYYTVSGNGSEIWVARLDETKEGLSSARAMCLSVSQSWEVRMGTINEAPCVVLHNGKYYMTYSANSDTGAEYAIGYAVSDSPRGVWEKYADNPILRGLEDKYEAAGHLSMFRDRWWNLKAVLHANHSPGNYATRYMYITDVAFSEDGGLVISDDFHMARRKYQED